MELSNIYSNQDYLKKNENLKWSQKIGQLAKVYLEPLKGIRDDEATSIYRSV